MIHLKKLKFYILIIGLLVIITEKDAILHVFKPNTAYAVGDLTVDWGIGTGNVSAIFTITNMAPGDTQSKTVTVTNNATVARPVGVRGIKTNETGGLSSVLKIIIKKNGSPVYGTGSSTGNKTLAQFFSESNGINGIPLGTLQPTNVSQYTFTVLFDSQAGNDYQNKTVTFTLHIGIAIAIPEACKHIDFGGREPLFGTQKGDVINGTPQNDLIFGFEGSDSIHGNGGDDCIIGGDGSDSLYGDGGNDVILGGIGSDFISGGPGNDKVYGESGSDSLQGDEGNDFLEGGDGSDYAKGGQGTDTCIAEGKVQCEL